MKAIKIFLALLLGSLMSSSAQVIVLSKDDIVKCPEDNMVLMDKFTFGKYHYTAEKYDTLKKEVIALDSVMKQREEAQKRLIGDYEADIHSKELEVKDLKSGFSELGSQLDTSIEKNNRLQVEYKKLDDRRRRSNRWRNFFMGTTVFSTGILVLFFAI